MKCDPLNLSLFLSGPGIRKRNVAAASRLRRIMASAVFLFSLNSFAQVSGYIFSEQAGAYSAITGTTVHAAGWTDPAPSTIAIPFTFTFGGTNFNSCSVTGNGFITFGATASAANNYLPISAATAYGGAISGLGLDLVSNSSTIVYGTTGTAPNRVFIVQWNNCRRSADNTAGADWNFQIRLVETSNVVEIQYGACAANNATNTINAQVGLRGSNNADFNNRVLSSTLSWAGNTTAGIVNNQTVRSRAGAVPPSGRKFIWTPPLVSNSCDPNGNVVIYSNYDGGILNINVDQNIPNLKIGICTYEGTTVNISGTYVGNVTAVRYAGYNASNAHCSGIINTNVNGVPAGIVSINIYPAATMSDPNGNPNIDCSYQCNTGNQGGCNTAGQVAHYFLTHFGGTLRFHYTQYGCWSGTRLISAGGNCCLVNQVLPVELSYFSAICTKNGEAEIGWETATETNNHYFTVERSLNGIDFETAGTVGGAGTSSQPHRYSFTDTYSESNIIYYRLRQTDYNGQEEIFPVHVFDRGKCEGNGGLAGYPNPAGNNFVLQFHAPQEKNIVLQWTDMAGRVVSTEQRLCSEGWNAMVFDIASLPAGTYMLHVDPSLPLNRHQLLVIKK